MITLFASTAGPKRKKGVFQCLGLSLCLIVLVNAGCFSTPQKAETASSSPVAIGVVDTQWLLKESKLGQQVTQTLNDFMKDRQALIELEQKELRNLESQLLRQGSVLSQAARQQREEQFRQRMLEYQQKVANMNQEVQNKQAQLFSEFREAVDEVVKSIARRRGLVLVIEKGENTTTRYHDPSLDISREVLTELDHHSS